METFKFYRFRTQHTGTDFWCNKNPEDDEYIKKSDMIKLLESGIEDLEEGDISNKIQIEIDCMQNLLVDIE